jgi:hypothetical protein
LIISILFSLRSGHIFKVGLHGERRGGDKKGKKDKIPFFSYSPLALFISPLRLNEGN